MSKKILNEATVRRFMGLANIKPEVVSNYMKEAYSMEEEEDDKVEEGYAMEEEEEEDKVEEGYGMNEEDPEDEGEADDMEAEAPAPPEEDDMDMDGVDITPEEAQVIIELGKKLEAAMPAGDEPEPEMDMEPEMDAEMPADDAEPAGDEGDDLLEAALEDVSVELSEEEVVQEVARRVAQRILKAKKAQKDLNEALGKK